MNEANDPGRCFRFFVFEPGAQEHITHQKEEQVPPCAVYRKDEGYACEKAGEHLLSLLRVVRSLRIYILQP